MKINALFFAIGCTFFAHSMDQTSFLLDNFYMTESVSNYQCEGTNQAINYELLLPRDFQMIRGNQKIPLFIIFDQQNESIYKNTLNTIDYLTSLSNIPSSCVLGIGFNDGYQRFTLSNYSEDSAGLATFLMDVKKLAEERIVSQNMQISSVIVIGHSRTAYMASQFLFTYPEFVNAAIVGSSQDISSQKEIKIFENFLKTVENQKLKRYLLYSSGRESWGDADEIQTTNMLEFFLKYDNKTYFVHRGKQFDCDHYNSLGFGLNEALSFLFQGHNYAMQESFKLLNSGTQLNYNREDFERIYCSISDSTGLRVERDVSFYVSMFYGYLNDYFGHYEANKLMNAKLVLDEAIARFNLDYRYTIHYATLLYELGEISEAQEFWASRLSLLKEYKWKDEKGIIEELRQFDELVNQE